MSGRSTLYDAIVTALGTTTLPSTSTSIRYVTRNIEEWWNWSPDRFPGVRVVDRNEEKKPLSFWGTTDMMDMESTIEIEVSGYVRDETNAAVNTNLATLISDIERLVMTSTGVTDVCADIWPTAVETDEGTIENLGTCAVTFRCRYFYNHAGP